MHAHNIDSYGTSTTSSTPDDHSRSVLQNTSSDKDPEQPQHSEENNNNNHSDSLENSEKVISETTPSSPGVTLSEKLEFDSALYNTAVDSLFAQNNTNNRYDFHPTGVENSWPYDLSRTTGTLDYPQSAATYYSAPNFRNHYANSFYNQASVVAAAMKGKLMSITPFHDPLSPPSSASSSDSSDAYYYGSQDNNSFINYHQNNNNFIPSMSSHQSQYLDDFCEILKEENYSVEDSGQYTTLTNASTAAFDMYLHDHIPRNFGHQHSTSSGDSRSPSDAFNPTEDYDNGIQNFTQLTQLTTRSNGLYASSPVTDGMISNYDSAHGLTPSLTSNR